MTPSLRFIARLLAVLVAVHSAAADTPAVHRVIPDGSRHQTLVGYGQGNMEQTTPKWYARYDAATRERILDAMYTLKQDGLGMNICRYPMPAADAPGHDHMKRLPKNANKPFEYADGQFNWTGHDDVLWLGLGAAERGAIMWASWYGYPYWLSVSGCAAGSEDGVSGNLPPGKEKRFIQHVIDVMDHFRTAWGIDFDYVNPINEPEADWWKAGGGQPGAHTPADQAIILYRELDQALKANRFDDCRIIGYDAAYTNSTAYLEALLAGGLGEILDVLACHQYVTTEPALRDWARYAEKLDVPLWMSEWGDWTNAKNEPGMQVTQMMNYATKLHEAFETLSANAWVAWEMGFVFDETDAGLLPRKSYWAIAQYSRHVRPGAVRAGCGAANATCRTTLWIDRTRPGRHKAIFVTVNTDDAPAQLQYSLTALAPCTVAEIRRTSPTENYRPVTDYTQDDTGTLTLTSGGRSITTVELDLSS